VESRGEQVPLPNGDNPTGGVTGRDAAQRAYAGAEEINDLGDSYEVVSEPNDLLAVRTALQNAGIEYDSAESSLVPTMTVPIDEDAARKVFKLIDVLEDCDDVQNIYANFDVSDDIMAKIDASAIGRACTRTVSGSNGALRTAMLAG